VQGLDLGGDIPVAAGQQQVAELGADKRVTTAVDLEVIEGHPVAPQVG